MLSSLCLADSIATTQLDSRFKQQEKRRLDLLKKQQEKDERVWMKPKSHQNDYPVSTESPCFVVDEIHLTGSHSNTFAFALEKVLLRKPNIIGRCLGINGVNAVISDVQNEIILAGYVTTRVLAGAQDLRSGELTLSVIPGTVNAIKLNDDELSLSRLAASVPVDEGQLLDLRDIEQAIENLRRVPTVAAEVDIVPTAGSDAAPGMSDLLIHHSQERSFRLTLSVDDSGYDSTGRYQGAATLALDNPLELSDLFYASVNSDLGHAENDGDTGGYSLHYSVPIN
jgi:hemolysin activation/secretion protein